MVGDTFTFSRRRDSCPLFQTAHDPVNGVHEIFLLYEIFSVSGSYQGGFVAYIGDIRPRETRCLSCQKIGIDR